MAKGTITGKELIADDVITRLAEVDKNLLKILGTYNQLIKSAQTFNTPSQGNTIIKERNSLDGAFTANQKEKIRLLKALERQEAKNSQITNKVSRDLAKQRLETQQLNKLNKEQAVLTSRFSDAYAKLSARLNIAKRNLKNLTIEQGKNSNATKQARKEYEKLNAQVRRADAAAGDFQRNVGNYPKLLGGAARTLKAFVGAFGLTSGIYLFAGAIKDALGRVRQFDASMQNLAGILGTTRDQIKPIEDAIIRVAGASVKTSREVGELAEILATLGKRGEDLVNLIKPANDLSIALQATSAEAAEFLVQTLNAFGEPTTSAQEFANTLTSIRTSTSLDFRKMADSFQYLTPISRILGKDLADTGAIIGLLADNGLKAESAGRLLGTAYQKLAKEGNTLESALKQINDAQKAGVKEYDLLAIASNLFGKQAAKIGIILANNTDRLIESSEAIRNNKTAIDDLVNQQLQSLDAQIKILDSSWEQLILTIESGQGKYANFFKGITTGLTNTINQLTELERAQTKVFEAVGERDSGTSFFGLIKRINPEYEKLVEIQKEFNSLNVRAQFLELDTLTNIYKDLTSELRTNNDLTDDQRKLYIQQITVFEELLKLKQEDLKLTKEDNEAKSGSENAIRNVLSINEEISALKKRQSEDLTANDTEEIKSIDAKIKALEKERDIILNVAAKKKKAAEEDPIEGTIAFYEKLIKTETDFQQNEARTAIAIELSKNKIETYQAAIDRLNGSFLDTLNIGQGITETDDIEDFAKRRLAALSENGLDFKKPLDELERYNEARKNGERAYTEFLKSEREKQRDLSSRIFGELFGTFASYYQLDLSAFQDLLEGKKGLEIDYAATINSIAASIVGGKIQNYELEAEKNREVLDAILNDTNSSEKKKLQAQKEFDRKDAELRNKKAKAERDAVLFQISIDTAQSVTKALLNAYALLSNPATAFLAANAFTQAAIAGAFGALQLGFVASKPLPQFFKGKKATDNFEGLATWGERRKEVKVDQYGGIEVSPNRTTPINVKASDIITPSMAQFDREIKNPNSDVFKRVAKRYGQDTVQRTNLFTVQPSAGDHKGIERAVERAMMKYVDRPSVWKGTVKVEQPRKKYHRG